MQLRCALCWTQLRRGDTRLICVACRFDFTPLWNEVRPQWGTTFELAAEAMYRLGRAMRETGP